MDRVSRPADPTDVFERLEERRGHRATVRKLQAASLAVAVLAATALGFMGLRAAFRGDARQVGEEPTLPSNGDIAFTSSSAGKSGEHLFSVSPDGADLRQLTEGEDVRDILADWAPDGRRIVFVRGSSADETYRLYVLDVASGMLEPITPPSMGVYRPAWSPDGSLIAFAGVGEDVAGIWVVGPDGSELRRLTDDRFFAPDAPQWSADSSTIAFSANLSGEDGQALRGWDVFLIGRDGSALRDLTRTPDPAKSERPIGWLANGNLLISESTDHVESGNGLPVQMGRWLEVTPSGEVVRTVLEAPVNTEDHLQEPSLSPDGRFAVFDSGRGGQQDIWFIELATGERTRVTTTGGYLADWQPVPAAAGPPASATPEPSATVEPEAEGRDLGLGFNLCQTRHLGGIDFLGDGTRGTAWTGTKVKPNGTCPINYDDRFGVAVDFTGDGLADSWSGETITYCGDCEPLKAMDLNTDGRDELIVILQYFSIMQYGIYTVVDVDGNPEVVPFRTSDPGHPQHSLDAGKPFSFWVGGDAGLSDWFYCESLPTIWLTSTESPIDAKPGDVTTVHETEVSLGTDGIAHIVYANTYTVSAEATLNLTHTTPDFSDPDCGIGVGSG